MQHHLIHVPGYLQRYRSFSSEVVPKLLRDGKRLIELIAEESGQGPCSFSALEEKNTLKTGQWPVSLVQGLEAKVQGAVFAQAVATFTVWNPKDGESWDLELVLFRKGKQPIKLTVVSDQTKDNFTLTVEQDGADTIPVIERVLNRFAAE